MLQQKTLAYVKSFQPDGEGAEEEEDGHEVDVGDVMVAALALQHTRIAVALNLNNNRHNQIFLNPDNLIPHPVPLPPSLYPLLFFGSVSLAHLQEDISKFNHIQP